MQEAADAAQSADVTDRERGGRIQRRLDALKISDRQFHEFSGVDRKTLRRAVSGDPSVRANTYRTIEDWLDRLEARAKGFAGLAGEAAEEPAPKSVKLTVVDESTGRPLTIVAEGPVDDPDAVAEAAMRLMQKLRAEREGIEGNGE